jgi:hypothetical protein
MYPDLPSFAPQTGTARAAMQRMGARGDLIDAGDNLTDPIQSILNPAVFSPNNPDNPNMTAGITFLGQFLDHDITFDKKSILNANASPMQTVNFRTAAFDLDSVYGDGPAARPSSTTPAPAASSSGCSAFPVPRPCRATARCATTCRATRRAMPSSPKAATTRTSSSRRCRSPCCPSITRSPISWRPSRPTAARRPSAFSPTRAGS